MEYKFRYPLYGRVMYIDGVVDVELLEKLQYLGATIADENNERVSHVIVDEIVSPNPGVNTHEDVRYPGKTVYTCERVQRFVNARYNEILTRSMATSYPDSSSYLSSNTQHLNGSPQRERRVKANSPYVLRRQTAASRLASTHTGSGNTSASSPLAQECSSPLSPRESNPKIVLGDMTDMTPPSVKEFPPDTSGRSTVPALRPTIPLTYSPFLPPNEADRIIAYLHQKMEQNVPINDLTKRTKKHRKEVKDGWCECCSTRYLNLKDHLESTTHMEFAANADNFRELDDFLCTHGLNL